MNKVPALIGVSRIKSPVDDQARRRARIAAGMIATAGGVAFIAFGSGTAEAKTVQSSSRIVTTPSKPTAPTTYTVKKGDTLSSIASRSGVSVNALVSANTLTKKHLIHPGQVLKLPAGSSSPVATGGSATGKIVSPTDLPANSPLQKLKPTFKSAAAQYGVDPGLLQAMTWNESGWQNKAVSHTGAIGVGQLMPDAITFINKNLVKKPLNPRVPEDNIRMSAAYLKYLINQNKGDYKRALAAYYQGQASLNKRGMYDDTKQYVNNVVALKKTYF